MATRAHGLVAKAKADGVLVVEPCSVCGSTDRIQAHHEDYDNPLDVTWYCAKHHRARHAEIGDVLMCGDLNIRGVPDTLIMQLKMEAASKGMTLREVCLRRFIPDGEVEIQGVVAAPSVSRVEVPAASSPSFSPLLISGVRLGADIFAQAAIEIEGEEVPLSRSFPIPPCPRCRIPMTDMGTEFVCGKGVCKQKAMSVETAEYQWENRGVGA